MQIDKNITWSGQIVVTDPLPPLVASPQPKLYVWGFNNAGSFGTGDAVNRSSPVQVGSGTTWSKISVGTNSTVAIKTDGTLWAWGTNNQGQLGQGDAVSRSSPTQVGVATTWSQVSMGLYSTMAITTN